MSRQIKSKERVEKHGEVFTNEREVKAMCALVDQECERIDSRFLEPACGDGNFLEEVLRRKLATVKKLHKKSSYDYERYSVLAVSSIYGVDIMQDNTVACRERLYDVWADEYESVCKGTSNEDTKEAVKYILSQNILCGNALSMMQVDENQKDIDDRPIIFPHWSLIGGNKFKRRDFRLDVLIKANTLRGKAIPSLTDVPDEIRPYLSINPATGDFMPEPLDKNYNAVDYRKVMKNE